MPTSDFIMVNDRRWVPSDGNAPGRYFSLGLRVININDIVNARECGDGSIILIRGMKSWEELDVSQSTEEVFARIREAEGFQVSESTEKEAEPRKPLVAESLDEYFVQKFEDIATDRFPRTPSEDDAASKEEA